MTQIHGSSKPSYASECSSLSSTYHLHQQICLGLITLMQHVNTAETRSLTDFETFCRAVYEIYTVRDLRDWSERPRAAAIFLSFWHHQLGQPIESLQAIFFHTVRERTMEHARKRIYSCMGRHDLGVALKIRRRGGRLGERDALHPGERDAFDMTCDETKFGKCAKLMETTNQAMRYAGIKILRFRFRPHDESGSFYNFVVEFGVPSSHHHR